MLKNVTLLCLFLFISANITAQESKKVTMKLTYKGNPLCFWDVTLKHGDVALKEGKTDDNGFVDFGYVQLLSYQVDASGYKKTANGEKKWDVKGYIRLNEQGHADFDFLPLVEETGMGSMMEAAWGLTLNDCAGSGGGSSSSNSGGGSSSDNSSSSSSSSNNGGGSTTTTESATEEKETYQPVTVDPVTGYQNQRAMYADKISDLDRRITKKNEELAKLKPDSKDYSDLSYDIKDLELERQITQLKLEKTDKEIANNYALLDKTQRDYYKEQEEKLKQEQKALKEKRDSGARINEEKTTPVDGTTSTEVSGGSSTEVPEDDETYEKYTIYTPEQIASMTTINLQKLKMEYQTRIGKRKTTIKVKGASLTLEKREALETEVSDLEKQVELMEAELARRKGQ